MVVLLGAAYAGCGLHPEILQRQSQQTCGNCNTASLCCRAAVASVADSGQDVQQPVLAVGQILKTHPAAKPPKV